MCVQQHLDVVAILVLRNVERSLAILFVFDDHYRHEFEFYNLERRETLEAYIVFDVRIAVGAVEQEAHDVDVALLAGAHESGRSVLVLRVAVRAGLEQQADGVLVAVSDGERERRLAALCRLDVDVALLKEALECRSLEVVGHRHHGRQHDRRVASAILRVHVAHFRVQEQIDYVEVARRDRVVQHRVELFHKY